MRKLSLAVLACALTLLAAPGCGVSHTPVTGVVTLDGQPYEDVTVTLVPENAGSLTPGGITDAGGRFRIGTETEGNGAPPGKYKVIISPVSWRNSVNTPHPGEAFAAAQAAKDGKKIDSSKEYKKVQQQTAKEAKEAARQSKHPKVYTVVTSTPLSVEVGRSAVEVNFELKTDAK